MFRYRNGGRVGGGTRITRISNVDGTQVFAVMVDEQIERFSEVFWDAGEPVTPTGPQESGTVHLVTTQAEFNAALDGQGPNDTVSLAPGTYTATLTSSDLLTFIEATDDQDITVTLEVLP